MRDEGGKGRPKGYSCAAHVTSPSNPGLAQTQRARSESCSGALSLLRPTFPELRLAGRALPRSCHTQKPWAILFSHFVAFAASPHRRVAVSPCRRVAVSPCRPFAHSPYRPFALSPYRPFAVSPLGSLSEKLRNVAIQAILVGEE